MAAKKSKTRKTTRKTGSANGRSKARTTKSRGRSSSSNGGNGRNGGSDAIALLKSDHDTVRELLSELESTTERSARRRQELLEQIAEEVRVHTQIEEQVFYPAFRDAAEKNEDEKLYYEAIEEHHVVDLVLPEIEEMDASSVEFAAKAKVLKDLIEHHAEEEEKQMFPRAKKLLDRDELRELGERMEQMKEEAKAAMV